MKRSIDLRTIDQLWVKYSKGHFGYSVQKQIWLKCGGKVDDETEEKLRDAIAWGEKGDWKFKNVVYDLDTNVLAHLPCGQVCLGHNVWFVFCSDGGFSFLAQRTVTCNI